MKIKHTNPTAVRRLTGKPSQTDIAECARQIWEQEGRPEGQAVKHWLQAEAQITRVVQTDENQNRKGGNATRLTL